MTPCGQYVWLWSELILSKLKKEQLTTNRVWDEQKTLERHRDIVTIKNHWIDRRMCLIVWHRRMSRIEWQRQEPNSIVIVLRFNFYVCLCVFNVYLSPTTSPPFPPLSEHETMSHSITHCVQVWQLVPLTTKTIPSHSFSRLTFIMGSRTWAGESNEIETFLAEVKVEKGGK